MPHAISLMQVAVILVVCLQTPSAAWVLPNHGIILPKATRRPSSRLQSVANKDSPVDENGTKNEVNLPPGRRTSPRIIRWLFDDSIRLLNPKTMASYQVKRKHQFGEIFKTNIFLRPALFVTSPNALHGMGVNEGRHRDSLQAFFPPHHQTLFGSNAIIVQNGNAHDRIRRLLQPSLSPTVMQTVYQPIIDTAIRDLFQSLPTNEPFAAVPKLRQFFVSIALQILLGEASQVPSGLTEDLSIWAKGLLAAPLTNVPWSTAAKAMRARRRIVATMAPLVDQARTNMRENKNKKDNLLTRLVESTDEDGNRLTTDEILDNVLTLIFAGSDTTASAATSLWKVLSETPNLKIALQQDPSKIPALVQTVLELYPPAPFQMRLSQRPLQVSGYDIPAGWLIVLGYAGALTDDQTMGSATKRLESVLLEEEATGTTSKDVSSSLAFGTGPRMCPGRYLATLELITLCQQLLEQEWVLEDNQNLQQTYSPGLFPKDGLVLKLTTST